MLKFYTRLMMGYLAISAIAVIILMTLNSPAAAIGTLSILCTSGIALFLILFGRTAIAKRNYGKKGRNSVIIASLAIFIALCLFGGTSVWITLTPCSFEIQMLSLHLRMGSIALIMISTGTIAVVSMNSPRVD